MGKDKDGRELERQSSLESEIHQHKAQPDKQPGHLAIIRVKPHNISDSPTQPNQKYGYDIACKH